MDKKRQATLKPLMDVREMCHLFEYLFHETKGTLNPFMDHQTAELMCCRLLLWPPDLFAFTSALLGITGSYTRVSERLNHGEAATELRNRNVLDITCYWLRWLGKFYDSKRFRLIAGPKPNFTDLMKEARAEIARQPVAAIVKHLAIRAGRTSVVFRLHAIADEACFQWGIESDWKRDIGEHGRFSKGDKQLSTPTVKSYRRNLTRLLGKAREMLEDRKGASISFVDRNRGRVVPKRHTASVGVTLRSLSQYVGFQRPGIDLIWKDCKFWPDADTSSEVATPFNVLLIPYPFRISSSSFRPSSRKRFHGESAFVYDPEPSHETPIEVCRQLREIYHEARDMVGDIQMVVLPECAIPDTRNWEKPWRELRADLSCKTASGPGVGLLVAGRCRAHHASASGQGENFLEWSARRWNQAGFEDRGKQSKHHPWKLEAVQVSRYNLGATLLPSENWWEDIKVSERKLTCLHLGRGITICPLICEDLARQDPTADYLRNMGPSLVVALLMDGPQLNQRWSSKYAGVLADDPGSSVLTLTSLGMIKKWGVGKGRVRRTIALWNDAKNDQKEIDLDRGSMGVVLSLGFKKDRESTMDGRQESIEAASRRLILGGITQVIMEDWGAAARRTPALRRRPRKAIRPAIKRMPLTR